jgi:DNA helicase-2/ATP-dependent DNA helicase PcrA
LFAIFRRGESEYEDAEDPFPKGRIPFLTIHQAKGLEFPVVVLGNPRKQDRGPQRVEELVHPLLDRKGEPLDRISEFDRMRMFYVALSRAQNLLVLAHFSSQGNYINPEFQQLLDGSFPRIPGFDVSTVPYAEPARKDLPRNYSYTGDYLQYQRCPRHYMVFRRYGLVPSRSQTMMFGSLVHRTMDDLHQYLIARRRAA